ncbi:MAG TPA: type IV toxin-antitoxin system AbiEi family antitoxin [Vicinamibacterales bacterium]|nr:type IV toxin-antitoxin system AbiEi family antitoxin [Vicinamibacterales bacterium]
MAPPGWAVRQVFNALRPGLKEKRFHVRVDGKRQLWARLEAVLGERGRPWALTGADAAARHNGYFRTGDTEIYTSGALMDDRAIQRALVAQPAVREGNLVVIEAPGPSAIPDAINRAIPVAPDLLVYAELRYRGTEQAMEAADLMLSRVLGDAAD